MLPVGRWCWGAVLVFCVVLTGCCNFDVRGDKFPEDELSGMCQQMRPQEKNKEAFGFSNKAKQIERNFGFQ